MYTLLKFRIVVLFITGLIINTISSFASHLEGGEITYKYLGAVAGGNKYEVTLVLYEDLIINISIIIN